MTAERPSSIDTPRGIVGLDHNATTPPDPLVVERMLEVMTQVPGNPNSVHADGRRARDVVEEARAGVARLIRAAPDEIIFTSGGTESDNLALLGAAAAARPGRRRVLISALEHPAVRETCRHLADRGFELVCLPVTANGILDLNAFDAVLNEQVALVSVMLASNDLGTLQPVAEAARRARTRGAVMHTDAVQAAGRISIDVRELGVDLLTLSAHKMHGPKGAGALFIRAGTRLLPRTFGGAQEKALRPGTENVAALAGFGQACELARHRQTQDAATMTRLRDHLEQAILQRVEGARVNGPGAPRLPNTSNIRFPGVDGGLLAHHLDAQGVEVSTGSACQSADEKASDALLALGLPPDEARTAVRFSLGRLTTPGDIETAIEAVVRAVTRIRQENIPSLHPGARR